MKNNQSIQTMQDVINDVLKPSEPVKSGKIPQETYHDLKEMSVILDNVKNLENQIEALTNEYDIIEKRVIQSLFDSGVFSSSLYADNTDAVVLVDDILVTCEYCDGYALGLQKVVKPEVEKS
jgi:hypothetical protein